MKRHSIELPLTRWEKVRKGHKLLPLVANQRLALQNVFYGMESYLAMRQAGGATAKQAATEMLDMIGNHLHSRLT